MLLAELEDLNISDTRVVSEGYFKTMYFPYGNYKVDPRPLIVKLGEWTHPTTGNDLIGGINLNYLTDDEIEKLRTYGPDILQVRNLKARYWKGRELVPKVFDNYYRTYNKDYIRTVDLGSLSFMTPKELRKLGREPEADKLQDRRFRLQALKAARRPGEPVADIPPETEPTPPAAPTPKVPPPEDEVTSLAKKAVRQVQTPKPPKPEEPTRGKMRPLSGMPEPERERGVQPEPEELPQKPMLPKKPVGRPEKEVPTTQATKRGPMKMKPLSPEMPEEPARPKPTEKPKPTETPEDEEEPGAPQSAEP